MDNLMVPASEEVRRCLQQPVVPDEKVVTTPGLEDGETFRGIRCPLCKWQPESRNRWCCDPTGSPEPAFQGCGTVWNTFATRGRCPGCSHQWIWTACHMCGCFSLHEDWYEERQGSGPAH